jgi:26S proteasome regulatory subunit N10
MGEAEDEDADAEIQRAIAMSMNPDENMLDPSFLGSLPGVDPNDPRIKDAGKKKEEEKK